MSKICAILNMAALYRAPIYSLMDKTWDIDWHYGESIDNIKELDSKILKNTKKIKTLRFGFCYWQIGILKLLFSKKYQIYLMTGESRNISLWMFAILKKIVARKKKLYLWGHGWYGRENFIKKFLTKLNLTLVDGLFVYGNYAKKIGIEQGNDSGKIFVIHNSLDHNNHLKLRNSLTKSSLFGDFFENNYPTLIFIGRLTKVKKLDLLFKALGNLQKRHEQYNLVLVGDGAEKKHLQQLAADLNIKTWFYGASYNDNETASLIYNADLCVSPGNVGLTGIHTMTFGTPVITHSNFKNQMPEFEAINTGKTGNFFEEDNVESLANTIHNWFMNHKNREKVREACYDEIDTHWTPEFQLKVLQTHLI